MAYVKCSDADDVCSLVCCCALCSSLAEKYWYPTLILMGPAALVEFAWSNFGKLGGDRERSLAKHCFPLLSARDYTRLLF